MSLRVSNLRLSIDAPESDLRRVWPGRWASRARRPRIRILRKALDLRDKRDLRFVYTAEVSLPPTPRPRPEAGRHAPGSAFTDPPFAMPEPGSAPLRHRPVVVGSGPGGLAAAYFLAEQGYRPLVLERGTPVNERIKDVQAFDGGGKFEPESNYLFGEGGAGTFSDGKLTCRGAGPDVLRVLEMFAEHKGQQPGKPSILYYHRPHLGSNRLPAVVKALRRRIEELGGEVRFHTWT